MFPKAPATTRDMKSLIKIFGFSIKVENEKEQGKEIKINPYDNLPIHRKLIDKKNSKVEIFDLGNHILIIGMILLVVFVSINVD